VQQLVEHLPPHHTVADGYPEHHLESPVVQTSHSPSQPAVCRTGRRSECQAIADDVRPGWHSPQRLRDSDTAGASARLNLTEGAYRNVCRLGVHPFPHIASCCRCRLCAPCDCQQCNFELPATVTADKDSGPNLRD